MGCPPSQIMKWKFSDVHLMMRYFKQKSQPNQVEIEDVAQMAGVFGAEVHGRRDS
jgi:pyridoxine 5'-phosphate synthase PdxJ